MDSLVQISRFDLMSSDVEHYESRARLGSYFGVLRWFSDFLKTKVYRNYARLNTELLGMSRYVQENADKLTEHDYRTFTRIVNMLTRINELYRKINYMDSDIIRELMNETLALSYEIEADIKIAVTSSKPRVMESGEYLKSLSAISKYAIGSKLAKELQ